MARQDVTSEDVSPEDEIRAIIETHRNALAQAIATRKADLLLDHPIHQELYRFLGVPAGETAPIDLYQNIGRLVYKYAGVMMEEVTQALFRITADGKPINVPNHVSPDPVKFGIDCYTPADHKAHEIKWRDATTDGDHAKKELNKITSIVKEGMIPVRIMYYMPIRAEAIQVQERILARFRAEGEAYVGQEAWDYIKTYSGVDLHAILAEFDFPHRGWMDAMREFSEDSDEYAPALNSAGGVEL